MWHKPCRTFHPWCLCIKTRCLDGLYIETGPRSPSGQCVNSMAPDHPAKQEVKTLLTLYSSHWMPVPQSFLKVCWARFSAHHYFIKRKYLCYWLIFYQFLKISNQHFYFYLAWYVAVHATGWWVKWELFCHLIKLNNWIDWMIELIKTLALNVIWLLSYMTQ